MASAITPLIAMSRASVAMIKTPPSHDRGSLASLSCTTNHCSRLPTRPKIDSPSQAMSPKPKQPPKGKPKFDTLTTTGRLAKAAYNRSLKDSQTTPTSEMSPSPAPPTAAPPKKKRKYTTLPPPSELEAEAKRKAEAKLKPKRKAKTPLTTEEKIAAKQAKAAKQQPKERKQRQGVVFDGSELKAVDTEDGGEEEGEGNGGGGGRKRMRVVAEKAPNLMHFMREFGQMSSFSPAVAKGKRALGGRDGGERKDGKERVRESVLVRPTERTKRLKAEMEKSGKARFDESFVRIKTEEGREPRLNVLDLPLELRQRIWRPAVVEEQFFVYPAVSTEQPDLAMATRQIRGEVLPIYYAENTFAVEVPVGEGKKKKKAGNVSLEPLKKWAAALREAGSARHIEMVRKWAFSWAAPATFPADQGAGGSTAGQEIIVSLHFPKPGVGSDARPEIAIHREASCLLPGHENFLRCVWVCYPSWLDDAVAASILKEKQERGKQIMLIAGEIGKRGAELVGSRCVDVELE